MGSNATQSLSSSALWLLAVLHATVGGHGLMVRSATLSSPVNRGCILILRCLPQDQSERPPGLAGGAEHLSLYLAPRNHHTRSAEAEQLDDGIGDTFVSFA